MVADRLAAFRLVPPRAANEECFKTLITFITPPTET